MTHRTRIIQVRRLPEKRRNRLEKFLLLFNQSWATKDKYILDFDLSEIPEEFRDIAKYLEGPAKDEAFRKQLEGEEEIEDILREKDQELIQERLLKEEAIQREREAKQREREAKQREEEAKQRETEAKQQAKFLQIIFAKHLFEQQKSISEISELTGLSREELLKIKDA